MRQYTLTSKFTDLRNFQLPTYHGANGEGRTWKYDNDGILRDLSIA